MQKGITKTELVNGLKELGVEKGMVIEAHTALDAFGFVIGKAQTVVDAYFEIIGYEGTLAVPLLNQYNREPSYSKDPVISYDLGKKIRETMPAFDKRNSELNSNDLIIDNLRRREGIVISNHPNKAYCAYGKYARLICGNQPYHFSWAEDSPTSHLYDLNGYLLLCGLDYSSATALTLAAYRSQKFPIILEGGAVEVDNQRIWKKYLDIDIDMNLLNQYANEIEKSMDIRKIEINNTICKLVNIRQFVDALKDRYYEE